MRKLLCVLLIMICAASACAEVVQMPGLSFEVPAGYAVLETGADGVYTFFNESEDTSIIGACIQIETSNLETTALLIADTLGRGKDDISSGGFNKGLPLSYIIYDEDGSKTRLAVMTSGQTAYVVGTIGGEEMMFYNLLWSIEADNLIGVGGYEVISTQEYVRPPFKGRSFRVYTETGKVNADTAMSIWWELYYKNMYEGYDLTSAWFYDMRSAAGSGLPYGQIMQDELSQEVEYHENH